MSDIIVLVVDDSRPARLATRMVLKAARPDWTVLLCEGGEDALAKARPELTDLDAIMLDLNMPGIDGLELASQLRPLYPDTPMALVTANIQRRVKERAESVGCMFIDKPISEEKILPFLELVTGG